MIIFFLLISKVCLKLFFWKNQIHLGLIRQSVRQRIKHRTAKTTTSMLYPLTPAEVDSMNSNRFDY